MEKKGSHVERVHQLLNLKFLVGVRLFGALIAKNNYFINSLSLSSVRLSMRSLGMTNFSFL